MKINDKLVKTLQPPDKGYRLIYDDDLKGFGVRITANGVISFVLSYYFHGIKKRYKIGRYGPELTAAAARDRALKKKTGLLDGIDPAEEKRQSDNEPTFTELTERYLETVAAKKRAGSLRNDRGHIRYLLPRWGTRRVKAITQRDVERLHSELKATPYHANRRLALLSKMFNLAVEWKWCERNPAEGIKKFDEDKRERWLTVDELSNLNGALDAYSDQNAANVIRLLLLTGAREGEALKADWSQFDMKRGVWTKPSHHTKQKKIEHVPLSEPAIALLRKMKPKASGPLFPGAGADGSSRVTLRRPWKQVCKAAGLATAVEVKGKRRMITRYKPTLRIHDLRHTYASHLVSGGVSLHIVGKLLGHTQASTTQRYAHVADEAMRDATERFGAIMTAAGSK
jgi:integrase